MYIVPYEYGKTAVDKYPKEFVFLSTDGTWRKLEEESVKTPSMYKNKVFKSELYITKMWCHLLSVIIVSEYVRPGWP